MSTNGFGGHSGYWKWFGLAIVSCSMSTKYVIKKRFTAKKASRTQSSLRRLSGIERRIADIPALIRRG